VLYIESFRVIIFRANFNCYCKIVIEVLVAVVPEVGGLGFQERDGHPARNRGHAQGQPRIPGEWARGQFIQS
jgi:hypothetical protein